MRLEVLVGQEVPRIYSLNKPKILLGSHEPADIVVAANGISRRHLIISVESETYYVTDQGSTNGTFLNEERLVPGRKVEFTSFFPLRIGDGVLLTLLSDEEASSLGFSETTPDTASFETSSTGMQLINDIVNAKTDKTQVMSLKDLREVKTASLIKKREANLNKRRDERNKKLAKEKNKESIRVDFLMVLAMALIGYAVYYHFLEKKETPVKKPRPIAVVGERIRPPEKTEEAPPIKLVPSNELPAKESLLPLLQDFRCALDIEKYLCDRLRQNDPWGVVLVGASVDVLIDFDPYLKVANKINETFLKISPPSNPEFLKRYHDDLDLMGISLFLVRTVPDDLNYSLLEGKKLNFAFFVPGQDPGTKVVKYIVSIYPESLMELKKKLNEKVLDEAKKVGANALLFSKNYYRLY